MTPKSNPIVVRSVDVDESLRSAPASPFQNRLTARRATLVNPVTYTRSTRFSDRQPALLNERIIEVQPVTI